MRELSAEEDEEPQNRVNSNESLFAYRKEGADFSWRVKLNQRDVVYLLTAVGASDLCHTFC
jgi:hypothetical protein